MKWKYFFIFCGLFLGVLWCALPILTADTKTKDSLRLDTHSLSNVDIIVSGRINQQPCPPELNNAISNTNLFMPDEQKLLREIPLLYANVSTNRGPVGTVRLSLQKERIFWVFPSRFWVARFQFTNSDMQDRVAFNSFGVPSTHYVRNKDGDGYDLYYSGISPGGGYGGPAPEFWLVQYKHGVPDGLRVDIIGDHCVWWLRFVNGLAVDQWLYWFPDGDKLMIWVKFKQPYDYIKHHDNNVNP